MYSIPLDSETCQGKNRLVSVGRRWDDNSEMDRRPNGTGFGLDSSGSR